MARQARRLVKKTKSSLFVSLFLREREREREGEGERGEGREREMHICIYIHNKYILLRQLINIFTAAPKPQSAPYSNFNAISMTISLGK